MSEVGGGGGCVQICLKAYREVLTISSIQGYHIL